MKKKFPFKFLVHTALVDTKQIMKKWGLITLLDLLGGPKKNFESGSQSTKGKQNIV